VRLRGYAGRLFGVVSTTVNTSSNKTIALGNGSATQFAFGYIGVAAAYIGVVFTDANGNETVLTRGSGTTQYQISLNAPVTGAIWGLSGTVTYNANGTPIAAGTTLTIFRTSPLTQAIRLQNQQSRSTRAELTTTNDPGELANFLEAHGIAPHYMDRFTHCHCAQLRVLGKAAPVMTVDGEELHEAAANALDSLHQSMHKQGVGRIVAMSVDEMRPKALEIDAAKVKPQ